MKHVISRGIITGTGNWVDHCNKEDDFISDSSDSEFDTLLFDVFDLT
jgi:hypothetical protein